MRSRTGQVFSYAVKGTFYALPMLGLTYKVIHDQTVGIYADNSSSVKIKVDYSDPFSEGTVVDVFDNSHNNNLPVDHQLYNRLSSYLKPDYLRTDTPNEDIFIAELAFGAKKIGAACLTADEVENLTLLAMSGGRAAELSALMQYYPAIASEKFIEANILTECGSEAINRIFWVYSEGNAPNLEFLFDPANEIVIVASDDKVGLKDAIEVGATSDVVEVDTEQYEPEAKRHQLNSSGIHTTPFRELSRHGIFAMDKTRSASAVMRMQAAGQDDIQSNIIKHL